MLCVPARGGAQSVERRIRLWILQHELRRSHAGQLATTDTPSDAPAEPYMPTVKVRQQ